MIVKVYSHLVDELKTKQAFQIPELQFPTKTTTKTVDETVDIKEKGISAH